MESVNPNATHSRTSPKDYPNFLQSPNCSERPKVNNGKERKRDLISNRGTQRVTNQWDTRKNKWGAKEKRGEGTKKPSVSRVGCTCNHYGGELQPLGRTK